MGASERLSLEQATGGSLIALTHRHRYEIASGLVEGLRVVDLCCGEGYGSLILAESAKQVIGVDVDEAVVDRACRLTASADVSFHAADALAFLEEVDARAIDAVVCFEGIEHVPDPWALVDALAELSRSGTVVILSVPNDQDFDHDNPYHSLVLGPDDAREIARRLGGATLGWQWSAEGSVVVPDMDLGAQAVGKVDLSAHAERLAPEHAFIVSGLGSSPLEASGVYQTVMRPQHSRYLDDLVQANEALWRENARLGRWLLGLGQASAAVAIRRRAEMVGGLGGSPDELATFKERFPYLWVEMTSGWFDEEVGPDGQCFRWLDGVGLLRIGAGDSSRPPLVIEGAALSFLAPDELVVACGGETLGVFRVDSRRPTSFQVDVPAGKGAVELQLAPRSPARPASLINPADERLLSLQVSGLVVKPVWSR